MAFPHSALIICSAALAASSGAHAVGFGRFVPSAVLGQPLNVSVPIVLDQGERLFSECVQAEVTAGDTLLPPSQVRVSVQATANPAEWVARITTLGPVLEPVLDISVSAGCERRFMRRFTAFADPPVMSLTAQAAAAATSRTLDDINPTPRRFGSAGSGMGTGSATRGRGKPAASESVAAGPRAATPKVKAKAATVPETPIAKLAPSTARTEANVARLLLDVGGPRLRLDMDDAVFMPATAASGVAAGPLDEVERLHLLEKTLGDLQKETQAYRSSENGLKVRLSEAESRSRMVPWLLGLLLLAVGAACWLAWRIRGQADKPGAEGAVADARRAMPWWRGEATGAAQGDAAAEPAEASVAREPVRPSAKSETDINLDSGAMLIGDELPADTFPLSPYERTQPFSAPVGTTSSASGMASINDGELPAREVSVEELLDLEQQADFFIALGQEDAAVDLLMSHLRGTGGQSPLPYTKLLEIYRRQDDRSAYERIRARFNRRFNAYAPDWEHGPMHGRSLEDYPNVVQSLEGFWSSPLNAMAVLEAMLFRNDERQELFDLPAYKDVLLLYSLARDLYQQEGVSAADVDLLLPLGDEELFPVASLAGQDSPAAVGAVGRPQGYDLTSFSLEPHGDSDSLSGSLDDLTKR